MKSKLETILSEIREDCERELMGDCIENAKMTAEELEKRSDYDTQIIKGAIDYKGEPTPETYEEAKRDGTLHNWVLVMAENEKYYCDIFMEVSSCKGSPGDIWVSENLPDHYIMF